MSAAGSPAWLWLNTVRYLKPRQVVYRALRRLPHGAHTPPIAICTRSGKWVEPVAHRTPEMTQPSRLRDYVVNYHDNPTGDLIESWMRENPPGSGAAWEPYPLSLRIVNWIKWVLGGGTTGAEMLQSLATQTDFLSRRIEHHLLGNHLFVNAKALVFAGVFFGWPGWLRKGLRILDREIPEQILEDGGHFERSPMYHCLILEDLLDMINLGAAYPGLLPDWREPAARMLGWLQSMVHQDGRIPFFNDSTFGVAPEPDSLAAYACRLGVDAAPAGLGDSGYVRLEEANTRVIFDAGPVGPDYQPGHAHCDTLSFEASHRGRRILVNSGISTYEPSQERQRQRGTAAHNTVRIDGREQSEIWAAFRVARRARPARRPHGFPLIRRSRPQRLQPAAAPGDSPPAPGTAGRPASGHRYAARARPPPGRVFLSPVPGRASRDPSRPRDDRYGRRLPVPPRARAVLSWRVRGGTLVRPLSGDVYHSDHLFLITASPLSYGAAGPLAGPPAASRHRSRRGFPKN